MDINGGDALNYLRELNAFRDWSLINRPSTGQVALWHSLMSIDNMLVWQEWFTVPNQTLQLMTGLSRQGLEKARKGLIDRGRLNYKKGGSNQAGSYRMVTFNTECQKVGTEVGTQVGTEGALQLSQEGRTGSTLNKQNKTKTKVSNDTDPRIKILIDHYYNLFQSKFDEKPNINGAKDGALFKDLLKKYDEDKIKALLIAFFEIDDKFIQQSGYTVGVFANQVNRLLTWARTPINQKKDKFRLLYTG